MSHKILVINPGSTSTKIAVYEGEVELFCENIEHDENALGTGGMLEQLPMRSAAMRSCLLRHGVDIETLGGVVGRGGLIPNLKVGGYAVNSTMKNVIKTGNLTPHASNLGALLADEIAAPLGVPAVIYDAVSSDNFMEVAKITGIPEIKRASFCHVLNSRAMGRKYAKSIGKSYEELRLIVAHLGGGISISAHKNGEIIDAISDDSGPFSPERSGSLPLNYIVDLCFDYGYKKNEIVRKQRGNGGLKALLGTSDCREIEYRAVSGDEYAALCYRAQAYQIAKGIGNLAPAVDCKMDAVIITGGLARSKVLTDMVEEYVGAMANIVILPGENEMLSLAEGMNRILDGTEPAQTYIY